MNQQQTEMFEDDIRLAPVKWTVYHPKGHIYVMAEVFSLTSRFNCSIKELELRGWRFEPHYE